MNLSFEQVEASKKLGRLLAGKLNKEEADEVVYKILNGEPPYASLWKTETVSQVIFSNSRKGMTNNFD